MALTLAAVGGITCCVWISYQTPCPVGTSDNSPAIYRWVGENEKPHQSRRDGWTYVCRADAASQPSLRDYDALINRIPALKCWAIIIMPLRGEVATQTTLADDEASHSHCPKFVPSGQAQWGLWLFHNNTVSPYDTTNSICSQSSTQETAEPLRFSPAELVDYLGFSNSRRGWSVANSASRR